MTTRLFPQWAALVPLSSFGRVSAFPRRPRVVLARYTQVIGNGVLEKGAEEKGSARADRGALKGLGLPSAEQRRATAPRQALATLSKQVTGAALVFCENLK
ncbi:hypothetical protein E2C01_077296 [Portunus trituberculatus]|uniref:Uncharacterized protein n=1 Tax=Portunus trituberculatus TaxID=210409 RepID=A0A5B7IB33_PORTR|nr:hypothetical protein [Portunus trituberculatus]